MNAYTGYVLHDLLKKGYIDRYENAVAWDYYLNEEVQDDLLGMEESMGFELERVRNRVYLVPTQSNDLFLKNNVDYRRDISANNDTKVKDLYLMNYLAIYFIYLFFKGKGADIRSRDSITKESFIENFTDHCKEVEKDQFSTEALDKAYSDNFVKLAKDWLAKPDGSQDDTTIKTRYGILNKILLKFEKDELFLIRSEKIEPTQKLKDLMPYFLRKERVASIQKWFEEGDSGASD